MKSHSEDRVEKIFELLEEAKKIEESESSNLWLCTSKFLEAHDLLQVLAEEESEKAKNTVAPSAVGDGKSEEIENAKRIAELYATKANEYWNKSRLCLVRAMEKEQIDDEQLPNGRATIISRLDDEEARARNQSFTVLFSRPAVDQIKTLESKKCDAKDDNSKEDALDQQCSIEERLQKLNKSLPSEFKTTDERMLEVNKGLNKLGLSLYTQKEPFERFQDTFPKSEEEQIDEIMAQAKDEAQLGETVFSKSRDVEDYSDSDDDDSDSDDEKDALLLDNDQLAMKFIQKKVVNAQVKLSELLAIVDEARSMKAQEEDNSEEEGYSEDDSDDGATSILITAKKKLKSVQRDMTKALAELEDLSP